MCFRLHLHIHIQNGPTDAEVCPAAATGSTSSGTTKSEALIKLWTDGSSFIAPYNKLNPVDYETTDVGGVGGWGNQIEC